MAQIEISDIRRAERMLRDLDKEYVKEFRQDIKAIAKPIQQSIKSGITYTKMSPPLSGMQQVHFGRVAWGTDFAPGGAKRPKPIKSALIQKTPLKARKRGTKSIVRVVVGSPGTVLADMAGSGNMRKSIRGQMTREYDYMYKDGPGKRRHRVTSQGEAFVDNLGVKYGREASRFVWPAAQKAGNKTRKELDRIIDKYNRLLNVKLRIMNAR